MADDIRITRWDLVANAGVTQSLTFTADATLTSLSVYTGGTTTDVDDLTDATEHTGTLSTTTLSDDTATVSLVVPASTTTPLRLVVDGVVATVGSLTPSSSGTASSDNTITLTTGSNSFSVSVLASGTALATHTADTTAHGTSGDVVGTSDTQTLTAKTLDSFSNHVEADAIHVEVRNDSGATLTKGTPVYITGYNVGQDLVTVDAADATSAATMPALGLVTEDITNNANGALEVRGQLTGLDTSSFSVGDELYVDTTAGQLVATAPNTTAVVQKVATVVRSHASLGVVDVATEAAATAYATQSTYGIVRFASAAEIAAGTATDRVLAPADNVVTWG